MWDKLVKVEPLCSAVHMLVGVLVVLLLSNPTGVFSATSAVALANMVFWGFMVYECFQWITKGDAPSKEIGQMMTGLCATAVILAFA